MCTRLFTTHISVYNFLSPAEADLSQDVSDLGAGLEKGEDGKIRLRRPIGEFDGRDVLQGFHLIQDHIHKNRQLE